MPAAAPRPFTGLRFAAIVVAFFAVVIGVNVTMATLAGRTFSGAIVRNGYVANQDFNDWLAAGRAQAALGWTVEARIERREIVVTARDRTGKPLDAEVTATLRHPIDPKRHHVVRLKADGDRFAAPHRLTSGQWEVIVDVSAGGQLSRTHRRLLVGA